MLGWIVRILFILAAPIAALLVSRDELNFGLVQIFVAMFLSVDWPYRPCCMVRAGATCSPVRSHVKIGSHRRVVPMRRSASDLADCFTSSIDPICRAC
jgi:hypothetical protein